MFYYWIEPDEFNKPKTLWIKIPRLSKGENIIQLIRTERSDYFSPKSVFITYLTENSEFEFSENIKFENNQLIPDDTSKP